MKSNNSSRILPVLLLAFGCVTAPFANAKELLNLDRKGVAVQGYDVVALYDGGKPVKGVATIASTHRGATYHFVSAAHKATFDASPTKFEPQFGGYCAYGVSRGKLVEIDIEASQVVDGRLFLQYSKGVRNDFNKDSAGNLKKADANWPVLLDKKGK
jgi:YHS domain-containing protein